MKEIANLQTAVYMGLDGLAQQRAYKVKYTKFNFFNGKQKKTTHNNANVSFF